MERGLSGGASGGRPKQLGQSYCAEDTLDSQAIKSFKANKDSSPKPVKINLKIKPTNEPRGVFTVKRNSSQRKASARALPQTGPQTTKNAALASQMMMLLKPKEARVSSNDSYMLGLGKVNESINLSIHNGGSLSPVGYKPSQSQPANKSLDL